MRRSLYTQLLPALQYLLLMGLPVLIVVVAFAHAKREAPTVNVSPKEIQRYLKKECENSGLPYKIMAALMHRETKGKRYQVEWIKVRLGWRWYRQLHAAGKFQISYYLFDHYREQWKLPDKYWVEQLFDHKLNIRIACANIKYWYRRYGSMRIALSIHFLGPVGYWRKRRLYGRGYYWRREIVPIERLARRMR